MNNRYMMRGVSASKEDVHNAIKNIDKGLYPKAFCKIIPDILGGDPEGKIHKLLSFAGSDRDVADPWYSGRFDIAYNDILRK